MAIELFWGSGSPYSWRALLALEVKGLGYESRLLEFSKQQHKSPEYLAINPRGKVPALREDGHVVYESLAILAYLDARQPERPLFGATPRERGEVWRAISECESYLVPAATGVVRPLFFGGAAAKVAEIREEAASVRGELTILDATLRESPWIAGSSLTAADLAVFPFVQLLLRAGSREEAKPLDLRILPLTERFPSIAGWVNRVERLPGYERTYPPHWR
ncbi:MAG: glutathione S-transferase family protein [Candidatus Binatia bacterium]